MALSQNRTNVSVEELLGVLKKSGLPIGGFPLDQTAMHQQEQIGNALRGSVSPVDQKPIEDAKNNYLKNLKRIAQADQKLNVAYSDPNSKLYIEHPLEREQTLASSSNIGYKEQGRLGGEVQNRQQEVAGQEQDQERMITQSINDAVELFGQLNKKVKGTGSSTSSASKTDKANSKEQTEFMKEAGLDITGKANVYETSARKFFLNTEAGFQKDFLRDVVTSERESQFAGPGQGFTKKEVESAYRDWQKLKKEIKPTGDDEDIEDLLDMLSKQKTEDNTFGG